VTLVFFWANWCGYCRQMFPTTRDWVEAYKGRPFAVIGVNSDADKDEAVRAAQIGKLTWPSIWDGGTTGGAVSRTWQIEAYPTLYLLDHAGVIRYKWEGKPENDVIQSAIDTLLAKADAAKSK
jgi:thiol-disulfide isomerase/thioredoxin